MSVKYENTIDGLISTAIRMPEMTQQYVTAYGVMCDGESFEVAPVSFCKRFVSDSRARNKSLTYPRIS